MYGRGLRPARSTAGHAGPRAASVLAVLVAAAAYAATLGYDLVWDDTLLIQQSWRLHHWQALPSLLTSHFWSEVGEASQTTGR